MEKIDRYARLVAQRKAFDPSAFGLANPSIVADGRYDSEHIGPWTLWANDLNADLMVVGQDWADDAYFIEHRGFDDSENPTNRALRELLDSVGRHVPPPPSAANVDDPERAHCGVWLTNALLWLK